MTHEEEIKIVKAALLITRATSPYSELAWICDIRAAVQHLLSAKRVDRVLQEMWGRDEVVLRRADLVDGVVPLVEASALLFGGESWHYARLAKEAG